MKWNTRLFVAEVGGMLLRVLLEGKHWAWEVRHIGSEHYECGLADSDTIAKIDCSASCARMAAKIEAEANAAAKKARDDLAKVLAEVGK